MYFYAILKTNRTVHPFLTTKRLEAGKRGGAHGFSDESCAENRLIKKSQDGNQKAFEELMSSYLKIIYNYISVHVGAGEDVKDIVQETMLSVWNGIKKFDRQSTFKTWALGIARRKIADYYRTVYHQETAPLSEYEETLAVEDDIDRINNKLAVKKSLTVLNKTEREIVYLIFSAQLSYREISEITGIPVGTIKSKMSAIKAKLIKQLENGGKP